MNERSQALTRGPAIFHVLQCNMVQEGGVPGLAADSSSDQPLSEVLGAKAAPTTGQFTTLRNVNLEHHPPTSQPHNTAKMTKRMALFLWDHDNC